MLCLQLSSRIVQRMLYLQLFSLWKANSINCFYATYVWKPGGLQWELTEIEDNAASYGEENGSCNVKGQEDSEVSQGANAC